MYIEYIRNQHEAYDDYVVLVNEPGINRPFKDRKVPGFKPTWLVRVSDMQVVSGSSVNGHYWALSYSWNQSGELIPKGGEEYDRIDEGHHQIIEYRKIQGHIMKTVDDYDKKTDTDFDRETATTTSVTFEALIQQICNDFGIGYIWFDQMCINQGDHDAKMQEIKQMHNIYQNALCTVALVPELRYTIEGGKLSDVNAKDLLNSQWSKRMWTLEEAYVSKNILFLGHNVHIWSNVNFMWTVSSGDATARTKAGRKWMACTALWYASKRTSSKSHDRIFAQANIFPELMNGITFSYKQPLYDLMLQFYGTMIQKDISMLLFGAPIEPGSEDEITPVVRHKEASLLPSWTGVNGVHITQFALINNPAIVTPDYTIERDCMHLASSFVTVRIVPSSQIEKPDDFNNPDKYRTTSYPFTYKHFTAQDGAYYRFTEDGLPASVFGECSITDNGHTDLMFVTTTRESRRFYDAHTKTFGLQATHVLPLTVDRKHKVAVNTLSQPAQFGGLLSLTEDCSECIIVLEPAFQAEGPHYNLHPVIKKDKDCYRSIGVLLLIRRLNISPILHPKQTFHIK